jgi:hypothetical protein
LPYILSRSAGYGINGYLARQCEQLYFLLHLSSLIKGQRRFCSDAELPPYLLAATQRRRRLRYGYSLAVNGSATLDRHDLPKSALDGYRAASGNLVFLAPEAGGKPVLAHWDIVLS